MRKKVNMTLDEETIILLDKGAKMLGTNRSRLVEKLVVDSVPAIAKMLDSDMPLATLFQEMAKIVEKGKK